MRSPKAFSSCTGARSTTKMRSVVAGRRGDDLERAVEHALAVERDADAPGSRAIAGTKGERHVEHRLAGAGARLAVVHDGALALAALVGRRRLLELPADAGGGRRGLAELEPHPDVLA